MPGPVEAAFEYAAGFLFGWMIFQALFMRDMMGGSYPKALAATFYAELVSMNGVMAGMMIVTMPWRAALGDPGPATAAFWFIMSIGLTVGFPRRLSHQLVAGGPRPEAWDDDHPARSCPADAGDGRPYA